jgi:6,7-dimethyl-8-ribityllumazine synthase
MKVIEGVVPAPQAKIAIVVSRFNSFITERLVEGAVDTLKRQGQIADEHITLVRVPGAVEIPLAVKRLAKTKQFDGIIALGCVIRGGTAHFEYVSGECAKGIAQVALEAEIPVAFGVLTTENLEQAIDRAGVKVGNKGVEAALSTLEMINVMNALSA